MRPHGFVRICGHGIMPFRARIFAMRPQGGIGVRGKSRAGAENGDCHQFAPRHNPRNKALHLKRIGWLYPIFRNVHFYHGLIGVPVYEGSITAQATKTHEPRGF